MTVLLEYLNMHVVGFHFMTHWHLLRLLLGLSLMATTTTDRFSAHCSKRLQYNWAEFLITNSPEDTIILQQDLDQMG